MNWEEGGDYSNCASGKDLLQKSESVPQTEVDILRASSVAARTSKMRWRGWGYGEIAGI